MIRIQYRYIAARRVWSLVVGTPEVYVKHEWKVKPTARTLRKFKNMMYNIYREAKKYRRAY